MLGQVDPDDRWVDVFGDGPDCVGGDPDAEVVGAVVVDDQHPAEFGAPEVGARDGLAVLDASEGVVAVFGPCEGTEIADPGLSEMVWSRSVLRLTRVDQRKTLAGRNR